MQKCCQHRKHTPASAILVAFWPVWLKERILYGEKWTNQHVTSVKQRKTLSPREESNPWPPERDSDFFFVPRSCRVLRLKFTIYIHLPIYTVLLKTYKNILFYCLYNFLTPKIIFFWKSQPRDYSFLEVFVKFCNFQRRYSYMKFLLANRIFMFYSSDLIACYSHAVLCDTG